MKHEESAYFDERNTPIDMLVIHCSAQTGRQMVCLLNELKLSVHYIIDEHGDIIQCVPEEKRAWHAGKGFWHNGDTSLNSRSIGIEIASPTLGQEPYAPTQIQTLILLCQKIIQRHHIPARNIVGHSDIAPTRKPDPGLAFPWQELSQHGIGLWYSLADAAKTKENNPKSLLAAIGYDTENDNTTQASAYAFCRHFLPQYVKKDPDINHLIDHILPDNFEFMQDQTFLDTLKAVAWRYQN